MAHGLVVNKRGGDAMATPQIPDGQCAHCGAPIIDLFAEWTDDYQTQEGKRAILDGRVVFDCYYCQGPLQLALPLALQAPVYDVGQYRVTRRRQVRCAA